LVRMDRPVVVLAALGCERIDDPRQLVGERHRGQLELVLVVEVAT
jgi:hypothetical protein